MQNLESRFWIFTMIMLSVTLMSCASTNTPDRKCKNNEFRNNVCQDEHYYNGRQRTYDHQELRRDRFYILRPR